MLRSKNPDQDLQKVFAKLVKRSIKSYGDREKSCLNQKNPTQDHQKVVEIKKYTPTFKIVHPTLIFKKSITIIKSCCDIKKLPDLGSDEKVKSVTEKIEKWAWY